MGRQIQFKMNSYDEDEFCRFLKKESDVVFVPAFFGNAEPEVRNELPEIGSCDFDFVFKIWNRTITQKLHTYKVKNKEYYTVHTANSEAIEFTRSRPDNSGVSKGRLWIDTTSMDEDMNISYKSKEFVGWYEKIVRWIKKNYTHENGVYISPRLKEQ